MLQFREEALGWSEGPFLISCVLGATEHILVAWVPKNWKIHASLWREISTAHSCTVITAKALVVLLVLYLSSFVFCQFSCYCITKGALRTQLVYLMDNLSCNDIAAIWTNSNKAAVCWYLVHCQMHAYSYSTLISAYAN